MIIFIYIFTCILVISEILYVLFQVRILKQVQNWLFVFEKYDKSG